jgi:hypothetical protein
MSRNFLRHAAVALAMALPLSQSFAGANDYEFQLISNEVKASPDAVLAVRLIHKPTGKPVQGAVLFRTRLDMSPEDMGDMMGALTPGASAEPGVYAFKADLSMAGKWALKLQAKVPGESETVQGTIILKAKD